MKKLHLASFVVDVFPEVVCTGERGLYIFLAELSTTCRYTLRQTVSAIFAASASDIARLAEIVAVLIAFVAA